MSHSSLAHCVSADFKMSRGIAITFKRKFKKVNMLRKFKKHVGDIAFLRHGENFIYYLITKKYKGDKPTYETLRWALKAMKRHAERNNVHEISLPKIGCGLGAGIEYWI